MSLATMWAGILKKAGDGLPAFVSDPFVEFDSRISPTDARAGIEVDADGGIEGFISSGNQGDLGRWDGNNSLNKADYQFRLDVNSGSINWGPSDPTGVWLSASGGLNTWAVEETGFGTHSCNATIRVRLAVSPFTEYDSATVSLTAISEP